MSLGSFWQRRSYEECIHVLNRQKILVTKFQLNQATTYVLYTCFFDVKLKLWDYIYDFLINFIPFCCCLLEAMEDCIAMGHINGKYDRRNFETSKKYINTCLHWHHNMVIELSFSAPGNSLTSDHCKFVSTERQNSTENR